MFELKLYLKLKAALLIDSLIMFSRQINQLIGKNINKLFGIEGVSLKNSSIFINSKKGVECRFDNSTQEPWPLGDVIMNNLIDVSIS